MQKTRLGLEVRAVTQNRAMAAAMGISTRRVDMWTFGIGSGVAGLGGRRALAARQRGAGAGPRLHRRLVHGRRARRRREAGWHDRGRPGPRPGQQVPSSRWPAPCSERSSSWASSSCSFNAGRRASSRSRVARRRSRDRRAGRGPEGLAHQAGGGLRSARSRSSCACWSQRSAWARA